MQEKFNKLNLSPDQIKNSNFGKFLESNLGKTYAAMDPISELSWTHDNKSTIIKLYGKQTYNVLVKIRQGKFDEATKLVLQNQILANQENNDKQDVQKALELSLQNKKQTEKKNNTNNNTNEERDEDLEKALDLSLQSQEQIEYNSNFDNLVRGLTSAEVKKLNNIAETVLLDPRSNISKNLAENLCPELFKDSKLKDNIIEMVNDNRFVKHCQEFFEYQKHVESIKAQMTATESIKFKSLKDAGIFSMKSHSQISIMSHIVASSFEKFEFKGKLLEIIGDHFFPQYALGDI